MSMKLKIKLKNTTQEEIQAEARPTPPSPAVLKEPEHTISYENFYDVLLAKQGEGEYPKINPNSYISISDFDKILNLFEQDAYISVNVALEMLLLKENSE